MAVVEHGRQRFQFTLLVNLKCNVFAAAAHGKQDAVFFAILDPGHIPACALPNQDIGTSLGSAIVKVDPFDAWVHRNGVDHAGRATLV